MRGARLGGATGAVAGPVIWAAGLALPFALDSSWVSIAAFFAIYAITALSEDVILGRAGMFDMGHAVYFGIGAYVTAILNTTLNVPILLTLPLAMLLAAAAGALLSAPLIRLRGDYLLVATIGFNAIFVLAMQNDPGGITGGSDGITGIGVPSLFGLQLESQSAMFWLDWVVLGAVLLVMRNLDRCEFGRALRYLKQDELAAGTLGVDARAVKTLAFALGAALAGLAGTLFAVQLSTVSPSSFVFTESVTLFAIVIVGGQGSIPGVLLGTALMFVVPQIFRGLAEYRYFVFGIAMVAVMVLRPQGLLPRRRAVT
ncbi:MAG: branched-chain amino acid ABC transporter permease [Acidiphilium sp.]|jgi:branched-chain amino acid transport system permease protein|uniref:Branched-chain amino acid ABC transporter permease n=1 Tax=Acidiphilium acidophilum TaxID=76588 RepID=A0AAW9DVF1_ACIAO|nr:branched-chain amino acid ABC transporter permease [Acidiphilium acidophilum]MDD2860351.1 branched-chain amino acid ABC transporter permease [Acidiphilium sp.]MDX5932663.1 branched-chain amino acid ABC transporter permease [Acidiphilium acidophilum]MEE3500232.1 branched-chain amino acid ABC transporter permease [Acidiphilium acidophilum]